MGPKKIQWIAYDMDRSDQPDTFDTEDAARRHAYFKRNGTKRHWVVRFRFIDPDPIVEQKE